MRLIIHAGMHKTGTTSFQRLCAGNREVFLRHGVCFPRFRKWRQHSYAAWLLQQGDHRTVRRFLRFAKNQSDSAHSVLISGEDFENCLVDHAAARAFMELALAEGFTEIEWIFVHRPPIDYLLSIYAEMSKHRVTLDLDEISRAVLKSGHFCVSTRNYTYAFVFDLAQRLPRFEADICAHMPAQARKMSFAEFRQDIIGGALLDGISDDPQGLRSALSLQRIPQKNQRADRDFIERRYVRNALGLNEKDAYADRDFIEAAVALRLAAYARALPQVEKAFEARFERPDPRG